MNENENSRLPPSEETTETKKENFPLSDPTLVVDDEFVWLRNYLLLFDNDVDNTLFELIDDACVPKGSCDATLDPNPCAVFKYPCTHEECYYCEGTCHDTGPCCAEPNTPECNTCPEEAVHVILDDGQPECDDAKRLAGLEPDDFIDINDAFVDETECWPCEYADGNGSMRHCGNCPCCQDVGPITCPNCGLTYDSTLEYREACPRSENCGYLGDE